MPNDPSNPASSRVEIDGNGGLGALTSGLISGAARGELSAQRELRNICGDALVHHADTQFCYEITATHSVLFARLCAAHGLTEDLKCLGAILFNAAVGLGQRGKADLGAKYTFEALSIYEQLAIRGDEDAALAVSDILSAFPTPEAQAELVGHAKLLISNQTEETA